eukprot:2987791-Lingulodinium_polyedra.AAC.1
MHQAQLSHQAAHRARPRQPQPQHCQDGLAEKGALGTAHSQPMFTAIQPKALHLRSKLAVHGLR